MADACGPLLASHAGLSFSLRSLLGRHDQPIVCFWKAAQSMLHSKKWSWLKAWAMQIARRRGMKKAIVALARRLAVILHRIWVDGTEFRWTRAQATVAPA